MEIKTFKATRIDGTYFFFEHFTWNSAVEFCSRLPDLIVRVESFE